MRTVVASVTRSLAIIPALLLLAAVASAQQVYKTVDENGVVSFSDTPPADEQEVEVLQIDAPPAQAPEDHLEQLNAMRETTDRMAADRREREKHRAELREINARSQQASESQVVEYRNTTDYWPVYGAPGYGHPGRPPYRPGYRPRPEHPMARPPVRPPASSGSNSQLMRPILGSGR
jgi:TolA-binding protein